MHRQFARGRLGPVLFALIIAACGTESTNPGAGTAQLKVVHAAPTLGAVDVRIGDAPVISGLAYGRSSAVTSVPAGEQTLMFVAGGTTVGQVRAVLTANQLAAITLNGDTAQVTPVIPDTGLVVTNRANIRLINIASENSDPPTMLSVLVNFGGVSPDSVATFGLDSRVASHGPLMYFEPGHFRFRFVPQGTMTVLTSVEFDVAAGEKKAVVLERQESGAYVATVVTEP